MKRQELAPYIDHTVLKPDAREKDIVALCREANEHGFAAVCVNPCHVALAASLVEAPVLVASVVGFPLGASDTEVKATEAARAVAAGADEIDMVINVGWLKDGMDPFVMGDIAAVVEAAGGAPVKVIIEAALLTEDEKIRACILARQAGARYVKTSTGFGPGGATAEDVRLMRSVVGEHMGIKASGGVRTLADALSMIAAGATRIGTSSGTRLMAECEE